MDLRLVGRAAADNGGKVAAAAARIAAIHHANSGRRYTDRSGTPHPRPGALQLVFCDLSTPADTWNVYSELRRQLTGAGVNPAAVRFIHEAKTDRDKADLFAACRDGRIAVLVGSTEKMGLGTNVQDRCVAVHHLDAPWRPADLEQRDGRGLRQGNQNAEVAIYRYATEGSFDVYSYQTLERKARWIGQIMSGTAVAREIDDVSAAALSYAEIKALASGNPLAIEHAQLEADVAKLTRLARAHDADQARLTMQVGRCQRQIADARQRADMLRRGVSRRQPTAGALFTMDVDSRRCPTRKDAEAALRHLLGTLARRSWYQSPGRDSTTVGTLGGFDVAADITPGAANIYLRFVDLPVRPVEIRRAALDSGKGSIVSQLEHRLGTIDVEIDRADAAQVAAARELAAAERRIGGSFPKAAELADAKARLAAVERTLGQQDRPGQEQAA